MTEQGKSWMMPLRLQLRADCCHALCNTGRVHKHAHPEEPRICVIHARRVQINFLIFKNNLPRFHRLDLDTFCLCQILSLRVCKTHLKIQNPCRILYSEVNHLIQRYAPLSDASVNWPKASRFWPICSTHERFIHQDHLYLFLSLFLMLIFIQLIWPLIHLYIYLGGLAITLSFFHLSPTIIPASN